MQSQNQSHHVRVIFPALWGELQVVARNCDWFMQLFAPVALVWFFDSHLKTVLMQSCTNFFFQDYCSCKWFWEPLHFIIYHVLSAFHSSLSIVVVFLNCFFFSYGRTPEQCPSVVSLLSESYNPHVRYGAAMALGIACSGTGLKVWKVMLYLLIY